MTVSHDIENSTCDWNAARSRFPVFQNKTYINSCSYGALSVDVMQALEAYMQDRLNKGSDWEFWVEKNEQVRAAVAAFLGASSDEIAVTTSASAGINAIASAIDFNSGRDGVVISDFEFPTTGQIWYAQEGRGAKVRQAKERDGFVPVESYDELIDDHTKLVVITQVCFRNGARLDAAEITRIAKERGALVMIDGYQGLGTLDFEAPGSGADFVIGGMVKYLLGTAGLGFLYARGEIIEDLVPTTTGWFAQADIMAMDNSRYDPSPTARRFEAGTPPVPNCYAAVAGLAVIEEYGMPSILARISELTTHIKSHAQEAGYAMGMPENRHAAMISLQSTDEHGLVAALEADDIVTSCRGGNLRISPHFYNNRNDIDVLFDALRRNEALLVRQ